MATRGTIKGKKRGFELGMRSFRGKNGGSFLVFRTSRDSFHVFQEVEAKDAARKCGSTVKGHTSSMWKRLWDQ